MAGSVEANWHFLCGRALKHIGRGAEAIVEFRAAGEGGNAFAWSELADMGEHLDEARLMRGVEAGDGLACGILSRLVLPQSTGSARRRLVEVAELGIRRGDQLSIVAVSKDLAIRGRRDAAVKLLRKMEHVPPRARCATTPLEYEALCAAGMKRAAERVVRLASYYGTNFFDKSHPFSCVDGLFEGDADLARIFVLMQLEKLGLR
jgi:hypothetical protein